VQNSGLALAMRYTMVNAGEDRYMASTAVLMAEIMKLTLSVGLCFIFDCHQSWTQFMTTCYDEFIVNRGDWVKLTVPSLLYTLQNSLQYFSMSQLSAPVFQVLYQMKIVTTAIFSVIILSRRITGLQWLSIVALSGGVALVQLSQQTGSSSSSDNNNNSFLGFVSVICGCLTSGFAGVYFEMVLKQSKASIWVRNIQLSAIGIIISAVSRYIHGCGNCIF
jgi:UDP-sugar transporter A1/2/3